MKLPIGSDKLVNASSSEIDSILSAVNTRKQLSDQRLMTHASISHASVDQLHATSDMQILLSGDFLAVMNCRPDWPIQIGN